MRYNRSKESALKIKEIDFAVKALSKMAEMARRNGDHAEAATFTQQINDLRGTGRVAVASTGNYSATPEGVYTAKIPASPVNNRQSPMNQGEMNNLKEQFRKQTEQMERERQKLWNEIEMLRKEKESLSTDMSNLRAKEKDLTEESQKAQLLLATKDEQLSAISKEKEDLNKVAARRQKLLKALKNEKQLDSIAYAQERQEQELKLQKAGYFRNILLLILGSALIIVLLIFKRFKENQKQKKILLEKNKIIEVERQRSDELLLNILPAPVAYELKSEGRAKARRYERASVMFTDFKNFTTIAEQLSPEQLVYELDNYFKAFDFITKQYKLEKIKTIGDSYMCASGLTDRATTPINIVKAAIDIQQYLNEMKAEKMRRGEPYFEARIGISTGAVVAGVVGVNKFAYDIWGDTVNLAARVQEACEPGRINISENTFHEVRYNFMCRYRGKMPAKNKGDIDMYYVDSIL
jgi:class 3 adenylate cyclase